LFEGKYQILIVMTRRLTEGPKIWV